MMRLSVIFGLAAFLTASAAAQDRGDAAVQEAQSLFEEATDAMARGKAAVARDLLRRSLALYPTIPTRFNLAVALRRAGQTTEAIATFEGLLREPLLDEGQRARVQQQIDETRAELATLRVTVAGSEEAEIELDGREVGTATSQVPLELQVDPGGRVVIARGVGVTREQVDLEPGEARDVRLHVISLADQQRADKRKRRKRRAAWITSATALVAAVVLTTVFTTRSTKVNGPEDSDLGNFPALRETE